MPWGGFARIVAVAAVVTVAACSGSGTPAPPKNSATTNTRPTPSSASPTVDQVAALETTVHAAWLNYWKVYLGLQTQHPPEQWKTVVDRIALNPIRDQILNEAAKGRIEHLVGYGYIVSRPYWPITPTAGSTTVVLGDCFDGSHAGSKFVTTGKPQTRGETRTNVHATLMKGSDSVWRVQQIVYFTKRPC